MIISLAKQAYCSVRTISRRIKGVFVPQRTLAHLQALRDNELATVVAILSPPPCDLLEIGAGAGWQALTLAKRGYVVSAIDVPSSNYSEHRVFPVLDYDGYTLPFGDASFDIIFSSNLLEHIPHLEAFQREIHRVLRPTGCVVHVLPSASWRFWTNLTHFLRYPSWPHAHGEHATNAFDEIFRFSQRTWKNIFISADWIIVKTLQNQIFYTGNSVLDERLGIESRRKLSRLLGSSCNIFILRAKNRNHLN